MNIFIEVVDKVFNKTTYDDKPAGRTYPKLDEYASRARAQAVTKLKEIIEKPGNVVEVVKALSESWDALGPEYQDRLTYAAGDINGKEKGYPFIFNAGIPIPIRGRERIYNFPNLNLKPELDCLAENLAYLAELHEAYLTVYEKELDAIFDEGVKAENKEAGGRKPYILNEFARLLTGFLSPEPKVLSPVSFAKFMRYHLSVIDTIKPEAWAFYTDGMTDGNKALIQRLKHKNWILWLQQNKYPEDEVLAYMAAIYLDEFGPVRVLERFQKKGKKFKLKDEVKEELIKRFAEREKTELKPALVKGKVELLGMIHDPDHPDANWEGLVDDVVVDTREQVCFRVQEDFTNCVDHAHQAKQPYLLRALYANATHTDEYDPHKGLTDQPLNFFDHNEEHDDVDYPQLLNPLESAVNNDSISYTLALLSLRGVRTALRVREYNSGCTLSILREVFEKEDWRAMAAIVSAQPAVVFVCLDREVPLIMALKHSPYAVQLLLDAGALEDRYPDPNPSFIGTLFKRDLLNTRYEHEACLCFLQANIKMLRIVYQAFSAEQKVEFVKQYRAYQLEKFQNEITSIKFISSNQANLVEARQACFKKYQTAENKFLTELQKDTAKPGKADTGLGIMPEYFGRLALGSADLISEAERAEQLYWDSANASLQTVRELVLSAPRIGVENKEAFRQLTLNDPKKKFSSRDVVAVVKFSLEHADRFDEPERMLLAKMLGQQVEALVQAGDKDTVISLLGLLRHMGVERESISKKILTAACLHVKAAESFEAWIKLIFDVGRLPVEHRRTEPQQLEFLMKAVVALDDDIARIKKLAEDYACISSGRIKYNAGPAFQYKLLKACLKHNRIKTFKYLIAECSFAYNGVATIESVRKVDNKPAYYERCSILEYSLWHESPEFLEFLIEHNNGIKFEVSQHSAFSEYYAFAHYQFDKVPALSIVYADSDGNRKDKVRKTFGLSNGITQPMQMVHYLLYLSSLTVEQRVKHQKFFNQLKKLLNLDDLGGALVLETLSIDAYIARYHYAFTKSLSSNPSWWRWEYTEKLRKFTGPYAAEQWNKFEAQEKLEIRKQQEAKRKAEQEAKRKAKSGKGAAALARLQESPDARRKRHRALQLKALEERLGSTAVAAPRPRDDKKRTSNPVAATADGPAASQRRRTDPSALKEIAEEVGETGAKRTPAEKRLAVTSTDKSKAKAKKRGKTDPKALQQIAEEVDALAVVPASPDVLSFLCDTANYSPGLFAPGVSTDAGDNPGIAAAVSTGVVDDIAAILFAEPSTDAADDQGVEERPTSPGAGAGN